jgi:Uma2 family endonuclease
MAHARNAEENRTMLMSLKARRWTRGDLDRMPDDGNRYEVVRGDLFVTPPPRVEHEAIVEALLRRIGPYVWNHEIGHVRLPKSVMIFDGSQVEPDLMVLPPIGQVRSWERMPTPLLVVEVLSDSTARRDRVAKRSFYLDAGVAEYWIVDADTRSIVIARRDLADERVTTQLEWLPIAGLDPLAIEVAQLFAQHA